MVNRQSTLLVALLTTIAMALTTSDAHAQAHTHTPGSMQVANVPVQIGIGPAGYLFGGPTYPDLGFGGALFDDQPVHFGLRVDITAVITTDLIREHRGLVPRQYQRNVVEAGEIRIAPSVLGLIPTALYLSPPVAGSHAWGATWSPIGAGLVLSREPMRTTISGSLIATLMYINSEAIAADHYFFARPGLEINLDFEIPVTNDFRVSVGWSSMVHIPQSLRGTGANMFEMGGFDEDSLWHIGQFYVQGHFRVAYPYQYRVNP